jgi:hypothetical protein
VVLAPAGHKGAGGGGTFTSHMIVALPLPPVRGEHVDRQRMVRDVWEGNGRAQCHPMLMLMT